MNSSRSTSDKANSSHQTIFLYCKKTYIFIVFKAGRMEVLLGVKKRPNEKKITFLDL